MPIAPEFMTAATPCRGSATLPLHADGTVTANWVKGVPPLQEEMQRKRILWDEGPD